ncbi:MAG: YbaK/EbsC family protein, partial [Pseudomonadota bacterium]
LTAQEDSEVPLKVLHRMIGGQGKFSFGSAEMMQELLGVTPGAVTALGVINDRDGRLHFAIDKRLLEHEKINCHPLTNEATTTIARDDLMAFFKATDHEPLIVDLNDVPPPAN